MNENQPEDVHVLYIAGIGRSGSTLLCRTLGSVKGCVGTGELMRILARGLLNGDLCSCGAPVPACGLWAEVVQELTRPLLRRYQYLSPRRVARPASVVSRPTRVREPGA